MFFSLPVNRGQRGFTLLLAAIISSIVLALGAAVFSIAKKQLSLSSVGRDSQFAFYAADTAAECALYWDVRSDLHPYTFATSSASSHAASLVCDSQTSTLTVTASSPTSATTAFQYAPNGYCAQVYVTKTTSGTPSTVTTIVHSDGFSTGCSNITSNPEALQRSVELHY